MLESGQVTVKNEVNVMVKNASDVVFGGLSFWMVGYGLIYGEEAPSNGFVGWGFFFVDLSPDDEYMGFLFASFTFQVRGCLCLAPRL
jgi:Amt family ammonium transporter